MGSKFIFLVVLFLSIVREHVLEWTAQFLHALLLESLTLLFHFLFGVLLYEFWLFLVCCILEQERAEFTGLMLERHHVQGAVNVFILFLVELLLCGFVLDGFLHFFHPCVFPDILNCRPIDRVKL